MSSWSVNVYNDYDHKFDQKLLDSVLKVELLEKGITADYVFGIWHQNTAADSSPCRSELVCSRSPYKVNLCRYIFIKPNTFRLLPFAETVFVHSMWLMLACYRFTFYDRTGLLFLYSSPHFQAKKLRRSRTIYQQH